jgi:hypothetical protein
MSEESGSGLDVATRTAVAAAAASAGLASPDLGALATMLTPTAEMVLNRLFGLIGRRRKRHVAETLAVAAEERSETVEELLEAALANDDNHELFMRAATVAQDAAMKEKRLALGRALAAGLDGDEAAINDELLFVRAVADLDAPHIRLLRRMSETREGTGQMAGHSLTDGWTVDNLTPELPTLAQHLPSLLATLEQHGLITSQLQQSLIGVGGPMYAISEQGRLCLDRLTLQPSPESEGEEPDPDVP